MDGVFLESLKTFDTVVRHRRVIPENTTKKKVRCAKHLAASTYPRLMKERSGQPNTIALTADDSNINREKELNS